MLFDIFRFVAEKYDVPTGQLALALPVHIIIAAEH